jgi:hypothetical protein
MMAANTGSGASLVSDGLPISENRKQGAANEILRSSAIDFAP